MEGHVTDKGRTTPAGPEFVVDVVDEDDIIFSKEISILFSKSNTHGIALLDWKPKTNLIIYYHVSHSCHYSLIDLLALNQIKKQEKTHR